MKKNKRIIALSATVLSLLTLSGCTWLSDAGKDWQSDTKGLARTVTVYSKTGTVLEKFEGDNVRTSVDDSGQIKINIDGKRIQILNADVIIKEK